MPTRYKWMYQKQERVIEDNNTKREEKKFNCWRGADELVPLTCDSHASIDRWWTVGSCLSPLQPLHPSLTFGRTRCDVYAAVDRILKLLTSSPVCSTNPRISLFYNLSLHSMPPRFLQQFTHIDRAAAVALGRCKAEYGICTTHRPLKYCQMSELFLGVLDRNRHNLDWRMKF